MFAEGSVKRASSKSTKSQDPSEKWEVLAHCTHTTVLVHCTRALYSCTVLAHCTRALYSCTVLAHCTRALYSRTVLMHCTHAPVLLIHCATDTPHTVLMHTHTLMHTPTRTLYSYCTHTALLLYSYCTPTVLILHSYCTHTALLLYSYCIHTALILHSYCTHTVLILHSYCTHTAFILYSSRYSESRPLSGCVSWRRRSYCCPCAHPGR
jgi:hypothetical protein